MLVLSRKRGETIQIGDSITVTVNRIMGGRTLLSIRAPKSLKVMRGELVPDSEVQNDACDQGGGK